MTKEFYCAPFSFVNNYRMQIPAKYNPDDYTALLFTLDCVAFLFRRYIPEIGAKPLNIIIAPERECPTCFSSMQTVFLTCTHPYWSKGAYQFAHELCHYAIPYGVPQQFRWLEESICQTASLFFLYELSDFWEKSDIPFLSSVRKVYAHNFAEYADNDAKACAFCDPRDPATLASLEADCYQRDKNAYIANLLLPIFRKCPDMWKAVPLLCRVPYLSSLEESLDVWQFLSPPTTHPGFSALRHIFVR